jgi:hypothetical protein
VARDELRAELLRRGVTGWDEAWKVVENTVATPDGGVRTEREILTRRRYSDRIALRLAEAHLPEFRRRMDVHLLERELDGMTEAELVAEAERLIQKAKGEPLPETGPQDLG